MRRRVLEFNGKDDRVEIPARPEHRLARFTIEAWVLGVNLRKYAGIVGNLGRDGGGVAGFGLYLDGAPGKERRPVLGVASAASPGAVVSATAAAGLTSGAGWHHLAASYDGVVARLYVDGVEVASRALAEGPLRHADGPLILGMFQGELAQPVGFEGCMAEVRLWRTARDPAQIADERHHALDPAETPELVGYWPLDGGAGDTIADRSSTAAHGSARHTPSWVEADVPLTPRRIVGAQVGFYRGTTALVRRADGTLWARGARKAWTQLAGLHEVRAVAAPRRGGESLRHAYALRDDGGLWRLSGLTGAREQVLDGIVDVSVGHDHALALREDGVVLGVGPGSDPEGAWFDVGLRDVARVAAGSRVSLALLRDGTVRVWGPGRGDPAVAPRLRGVTAIAAIGSTALPICAAADERGEVVVWTASDGSDVWRFAVDGRPRRLDVDLHAQGAVPTAVTVTDEGAVWSWGGNREGQAGRRPADLVDASAVTGLPPVLDIAHTGYWTAALADDGTVWEWGGGWSKVGMSSPGESWVPHVTT